MMNELLKDSIHLLVKEEKLIQAHYWRYGKDIGKIKWEEDLKAYNLIHDPVKELNWRDPKDLPEMMIGKICYMESTGERVFDWDWLKGDENASAWEKVKKWLPASEYLEAKAITDSWCPLNVDGMVWTALPLGDAWSMDNLILILNNFDYWELQRFEDSEAIYAVSAEFWTIPEALLAIKQLRK